MKRVKTKEKKCYGISIINFFMGFVIWYALRLGKVSSEFKGVVLEFTKKKEWKKRKNEYLKKKIIFSYEKNCK